MCLTIPSYRATHVFTQFSSIVEQKNIFCRPLFCHHFGPIQSRSSSFQHGSTNYPLVITSFYFSLDHRSQTAMYRKLLSGEYTIRKRNENYNVTWAPKKGDPSIIHICVWTASKQRSKQTVVSLDMGP